MLDRFWTVCQVPTRGRWLVACDELSSNHCILQVSHLPRSTHVPLPRYERLPRLSHAYCQPRSEAGGQLRQVVVGMCGVVDSSALAHPTYLHFMPTLVRKWRCDARPHASESLRRGREMSRAFVDRVVEARAEAATGWSAGRDV